MVEDYVLCTDTSFWQISACLHAVIDFRLDVHPQLVPVVIAGLQLSEASSWQ